MEMKDRVTLVCLILVGCFFISFSIYEAGELFKTKEENIATPEIRTAVALEGIHKDLQDLNTSLKSGVLNLNDTTKYEPRISIAPSITSTNREFEDWEIQKIRDLTNTNRWISGVPQTNIIFP